MKKILLLVFFFFISLYLFKHIGQQNTEKKIIIGMMNGYPPYMDISSTGSMDGFDVAIAKVLEEELHIPVEIKDLGSLSTLFLALENETIDAIMSGLDITKERAKNYEIIYYHGEKNDHAYIVTLKNKITEATIDHNSWKISVEPGSSNEPILRTKKHIEVTPLSNYTEMMIHLKNKKIDGFLVDISQIKRFKNLQDEDLSFIELKISDDLITNGIGIALKKGNIILKEKIQNAITRLIENGTIEKLSRQWGLEG